MRWCEKCATYCVAVGLLSALANGGMAQSSARPVAVYASTLAVASDERDDFAFELGAWESHTWQRENPLTGSSTWDQYEGVEVVRNLGNGTKLFELHADGPAGHLDRLSMRFYDSSEKRWTFCYPDAATGVVLVPAIGVIGSGQVEFHDRESYQGNAIVVRSVSSSDTPNARYFERSFSQDEGKTWEVNWITTYTRLQNASPEAHRSSSTDLAPASKDSVRDCAMLLPVSGASIGSNGNADALRILLTGGFADRRGQLHNQDEKGTAIQARLALADIKLDSFQIEQAFLNGGKTWNRDPNGKQARITGESDATH